MLTVTYVSFTSVVFDISKGQGFCSRHLTIHTHSAVHMLPTPCTQSNHLPPPQQLHNSCTSNMADGGIFSNIYGLENRAPHEHHVCNTVRSVMPVPNQNLVVFGCTVSLAV